MNRAYVRCSSMLMQYHIRLYFERCAEDHLLKEPLSLLFTKARTAPCFWLGDYIGVQITSSCIFHYNCKIGGSQKHLLRCKVLKICIYQLYKSVEGPILVKSPILSLLGSIEGSLWKDETWQSNKWGTMGFSPPEIVWLADACRCWSWGLQLQRICWSGSGECTWLRLPPTSACPWLETRSHMCQCLDVSFGRTLRQLAARSSRELALTLSCIRSPCVR